MTLTMRRNYGLVLPKNYVSIEKDEMEYIDGGGTIRYYQPIYLTNNLVKAIFNVGVGAIVTLVGAAVAAALGATGIGATLIPTAVGAIVGIISSIFADKCITGGRVITPMLGKIWIPFMSSDSITLKRITIGW